MKQLTINKGKTWFVFLIVILQIFIMINTVAAQSYILKESYSLNVEAFIEENKNKEGIFSKTTGFLFWFFEIKQISTVSAQESSDTNCCVETNSGALCQEVSSDYEGCENILPTSCEETSVCQVGTCIIEEGLSCSANSPKQKCEESDGVWNSNNMNDIPECEKGSCVLGSDIEFTTEKQCDLFSTSRGLEMDFRAGLTEYDFPEIYENLPKGACILQQGSCRVITESECNSASGSFHEDFLCTNENLETNCKPTQETMCVKDKIYFADTCGNPANIYDASKANANASEEYWSFISEIKCTFNPDDPESVKNCGNCDFLLGSQCSESEDVGEEAEYGNYVCEDLRCEDENGKIKENGEKWCMYDGQIGGGKDTAGSEHWIASCVNGEIEVDLCGNARGKLCAESSIEANGFNFTTAACVVNEANQCLSSNSGGGGCDGNPHCQTKRINVDKGFKYDLCTPKYPKGFDLSNTGDSNGACSIANNICKVVYVKPDLGPWKCVQNCECEKIKFATQMNDLCISLGDCGSFVNYEGGGTDNIIVENSPTVSWSQYTGYANTVEGQTVSLMGLNETLEKLESIINPGYTAPDGEPREIPDSVILANVGTVEKGITYGSKIVKAYFSGVYRFPLGMGHPSLDTGADQLLTGFEGVGQEIENFFSAANLQSFGISMVAGAIGNFIGGALADALGLQGPSAQIFQMAAGLAVTSLANMAFPEMLGAKMYSFNAFGFNFVGFDPMTMLIAALVIMAITAIMNGGVNLPFSKGKIKIIEVKFECLPWQAPSGAGNCELCNNDPLRPCTKYRCDSLGQACELINENTDNPLCVGLEEEAIPPQISAGEIKTSGHKFQNPETKSVEIRKNNGGCIPEFTSVGFTLKTDEVSQCKWELKQTADYDSMVNFVGEGNQYSLEHNLAVQGLSLNTVEANNLSGDAVKGFTGNIKMYVRCKDNFGNFNLDEYIVDFCVSSGIDSTSVSHSTTLTFPQNNKKLAYGTTETNLTMWVNEPAECKYSKNPGKSYSEMENTFSCKKNLVERELLGWRCNSHLKNLESENTFYIKCKDQPWFENTTNESKRNANVEDFVYNLYVSENELEIDNIFVSQNSKTTDLNKEGYTEIKGGSGGFSLKIGVETSKGINDGVSLCSYSWNSKLIPFLDTNSKIHKQEFQLVNGNYNIPITCIDSSGNKVEKNAKIILLTDNNVPKVVRTFHDSGNLNIITNEQAKCYVSFDKSKQCNFNFEEAESMDSLYSVGHSTKWINGKTYYIKCEDVWENKNPSCAVKVTAS